MSSRLLILLPILLREIRRDVNTDESVGLTLPQYRILCHLDEESCTNKSLAEATGVSVAATSRMVDGLVARGLVERKRDPKDKRLCHLELSSLGQQQHLDFRERAGRTLGRHLSKLSASEVESIGNSMDKLLEIFRSAPLN